MGAASKITPEFHVQVATAADLPEIIRVVNAAFAVETFIDGTRTDAKHILSYHNDGQFLVAKDANEHIAASVYVEVNGSRGYFGMLAVDPARQGKGLGRLMIESAETHCRERGCGVLEIAVLSLRPELPPFYEKYGYAEVGTEEFRPSRPIKPGTVCHVIKMEKQLSR